MMATAADRTGARETGGRRSTRRGLQTGAVRLALGGTLGGALGGALAACGGGSPVDQGAALQTRRPATVQFGSRWGSTHATEAIEIKNLALYNEKFAPTRVERTPFPGNHAEWLEKLTVAFASDTQPDVFTVGTPGIPRFGLAGSLLPLDGYPAARKEADDFFVPALEVGKISGTLYGFEYFIDANVMLYRKDLLAEVGLPADRQGLPKTWDQFRDVARKLTQWDGTELKRIGFDVSRADETLHWTMMQQLGKTPFDKDMKRSQLDSPEAERALQLLVDLIHKDRVDSTQRPQLPQGVAALASPHLASQFGNSAVIANVKRTLDPQQYLATDFVPEFSAKTSVAGYLGGTWILSSKATKVPAETVDVLLYLSSKEHLLQVAEATTTIVARKSLGKSSVATDPLLRPYYEMLQYGWSLPKHAKIEQIRQQARTLLQDAVNGKVPVKAALAEMHRAAIADLASG